MRGVLEINLVRFWSRWEKSMGARETEREKRQAEFQAKIDVVVAAITKQFNETAEFYKDPLLGRDHEGLDLDAIAKELSNRYRNARFTVSYENGYAQLFVQPAKLTMPTADRDDDRSLKTWEDAVLANNLFPKFGEMRAFALGFSVGWKNRAAHETNRRRDEERRSDRMGPAEFFWDYGPVPMMPRRRW